MAAYVSANGRGEPLLLVIVSCESFALCLHPRVLFSPLQRKGNRTGQAIQSSFVEDSL